MLAMALAAVPLTAQDPTDDWQQPFVVRVEIFAGEVGSRLAPVRDGDWLVVPEGGRLELDVIGIDQSGRVFPAERFAYGLELDWRCRGVVGLAEAPDGTEVLVAEGRTAACEALVSVAGNMNLDRSLRVQVGTLHRSGFSRSQAEWTARRLYEAILGREADARGLSSATAVLQRGDLEGQVRLMFESREFQVKRSGLTPAERLEGLYKGLLGREPDSNGVRAFLDGIARGNQIGVTLTLLRSEEFERRLLREAGR